jgi:membrane protease YdiL (CAAX protease family)
VPAGIEPRRRTDPAWSPLAAIGGLVAVFFMAGLLGTIPAGIGGDLDDPSPGVNFASIVVQDTALIIGIFLFARLAPRRPRLGDFGLRPTRFWKAVGLMVVIYLAYTFLGGVWLELVNAPSNDNLIEEIGAKTSTLAAIGMAFGVCVMAPLAEEFAFRGYLFGGLRRWKGIWPAALITGALFGAVHGFGSDVSFLLPLGVFGVGLCLLYAWTDSLYPCIALHCVNNCIAYSVGLGLSWEVPILFIGSLGSCFLVLLAARRVA